MHNVRRSSALEVCVLLASLAVATSCHAATITSNGTGGGNWGTGGSWAGGAAPAPTDHVVIQAGDQINLNVNATCVNITVAGTLNLGTNNRTLTVNGSLTFNGVGAISGSGATRVVNVALNMAVSAGATTTISGITLAVTGPTAVTGSLTFTSTAASRTFTGAVTVNGSLQFTANSTLAMLGGLVAANGSTIGGGGGTGIINVTGNLTNAAGASTSIGTITLTCFGTADVQGTVTLTGGTFNLTHVQFSGTGVLDASTGVNAIKVSGNWTDGSSAADPFVEGTSTVTLTGSSGTQTIADAAGMETFYNLIISNTSATSPGIAFTTDVTATEDLDHTSGVVDLGGYKLRISGSTAGQTHALASGSLISSTAGASFTVTDPNNVDRTTFTNYRIGTAAQGVTINVTCGRLSLVGFTQWGTASFTKTMNVDDVYAGGNYFHGPVTFTANASASRWRMGDNAAQPDTFVSATFNANALGGTNNNFIVGANSLGNAFYGTTRITSTTVGGVFICRQNGTGLSSSTFYGPVIPKVTLTGNITFADAAAAFPNTVTFNSTVQAQSSTTSTGDIYFGGSAYSTVLVSPTGQFIQGLVTGQTSIHFRNVTQTGNLQQSLIGVSNSRVYCGGATYPVIFNGPVDLKADTVQVVSTTFNGNADLWGMSHLTLANSAFNGSPNTFLKQGVGNSISTGGNTFIAGSTSTFTSSGTGYMRLADTQPDDVNGDVNYIQTGSGALQPAYGAACTYSANISTTGSTTPIQFGVGGGTVVLDGMDQHIIGEATDPPLFYRLTTALSGTLHIEVPATVRTLLTMTSGKVYLHGNILTLGISTATPGTLAYTSGWFYSGSFTRWVAATAIALGNVAGLFPMGSATTDYRPLWFSSTANLTTGGTIRVQHTPTTSGSVLASHVDASWGNTVTGVSIAAWPVSTGNGLAVNGSTARLRYGGTGFDPFVLSDLDASQSSAVIGTFAAATNAVVPLEVNRTALNTAALSRTWLIGTKNISQSPLPIELLFFHATPANDGQVDLTWATATEHDNDHFIMERSPDAQEWFPVGQYPAAGNSVSRVDYAQRDADPLPGTSYYRLQQVDVDGTSTYAPVQVVQRPRAGIQPYPVPASSVLHIPGSSNPRDVQILDADGRIISAPITVEAGRVDIDVSALPPGIYAIRTSDGVARAVIAR